jgi:hypothetical protein
MSESTTETFDPTEGTTPVALPKQDACCQSPCDPAWQTGPSCTTFTETKTAVVSLVNEPAASDLARGFVTVNVTYTHRLCLTGKQHGGLAYTLTLLPGEKMTVYQSDPKRPVSPHHIRDRTVFRANHVRAVYVGPLPAAEFQRFQFPGPGAE